MKGNVLITGSSSGLGFSLAKKFKELNYTVYGISRSFTHLYINQQICDFSKPNDISYYLKHLFN